MQSKLHIDLSRGIVEIEGDADLVREIYRDVKDRLLDGAAAMRRPQNSVDEESEAEAEAGGGEPKQKTRRRPAPKRRQTNGDEGGPSVVADSPKLDKNLDTSGLPAFYDRYEAKNNPEKILIFLKYMTDDLSIEAPNTDQFYTCFEKVNERVPKVFSQAFRDASGRKFGYIDYNSPTDIRITTVGSNHFKFDLKKKAAE